MRNEMTDVWAFQAAAFRAITSTSFINTHHVTHPTNTCFWEERKKKKSTRLQFNFHISIAPPYHYYEEFPNKERNTLTRKKKTEGLIRHQQSISISSPQKKQISIFINDFMLTDIARAVGRDVIWTCESQKTTS